MDLKIISYNGTGFNQEKANFLNFLIKAMQIDVFVLQEHMHLKNNLYKIHKEFQDFDSFMLPATKKNDVVRSGRPSGGLGIFWRNSFSNNVRIVKHPDSHRVQAIIISNKFALINVYFPTDPNVMNFDDMELLKCLHDVKWFLTEFSNLQFILAGDLNCDFSRHSRFVNIIRDFFINNNLISAWSNFNIDFTFSNHSVRNGNNVFSSSCIDHFVMKNSFLADVSHAQVIHLGDNLSNHDPIYLSVKINSTPHDLFEEPSESDNISNKPMWNKASSANITNYRHDLSSNLNKFVLTDGVKCNDVTCSDPNHLIDLDNFYAFLTESVDTSVKNNIPMSNYANSNKPRGSVVPGWSEYVKPYRENAQFWHAIWVSLNRPLAGEVYNNMKHTRNLYHYAVRKVKKIGKKLSKKICLLVFWKAKLLI